MAQSNYFASKFEQVKPLHCCFFSSIVRPNVSLADVRQIEKEKKTQGYDDDCRKNYNEYKYTVDNNNKVKKLVLTLREAFCFFFIIK